MSYNINSAINACRQIIKFIIGSTRIAEYYYYKSDLQWWLFLLLGSLL